MDDHLIEFIQDPEQKSKHSTLTYKQVQKSVALYPPQVRSPKP